MTLPIFRDQKVKLCLFLMLTPVLFSLGSGANAQEPAPTATPTQAQISRDDLNQKSAGSRRFESLSDIGMGPRRRIDIIHFQTIRDFYRKPTKDEQEILQPSKETAAKYAEFLKKNDTGLIKLFNDRGCSDHSFVVVASEECLKYSMPGGGSSYSFRADTYRIWRLADLTYSGGKFQSLGVLLQGILVNIGNIPLEAVSNSSPGMDFLAKFEPPTEFEEAKETDAEFMQGKIVGDLTYARTVAAASRSTYILRSIAYRGKVYRSYQGINYNELEFDKRRDVTVAFRIVDADEESVTILWKQIESRDAPKIKVPKMEFKD
ncbi:MAG: hypothetical protein KIS76_12285 [Pyrinomonadaceae bacterium]|nr:hypothetical protein [Pyrinomonadaceae bacterium]